MNLLEFSGKSDSWSCYKFFKWSWTGPRICALPCFGTAMCGLESGHWKRNWSPLHWNLLQLSGNFEMDELSNGLSMFITVFFGGNSYLQAIQDLFRCSPVYLAFESWSGCREGSVGLKRTIASQSEALEAQSCAIFVAGTSELDPPSWVPGCIPNRCILCHRKMAPLPSLPQVGRRLWTRASSWYRLSMVETCWSYPDHLQCIQPMFKNQWFSDGVHTP